MQHNHYIQAKMQFFTALSILTNIVEKRVHSGKNFCILIISPTGSTIN